MADLNDYMNEVLWVLQQSELVNFGGAPNYASATNPAISENALIWSINRAYQRVLVDLSDCEIELAYFALTSVANASDYALPPGNTVANPVQNIYNLSQVIPVVDLSAYAPVQRVSRILYLPAGQPWTQSMEGGIRLVSYRQYLGYSAFGYLRPFTYNIIPDFCAVTPNRKILSFFPGTASNGDTIGVEYTPTLAAGTTFPPLAGGTDVPILPDEAFQMVVNWAASLCWPKLREMGAKQEYETMYAAEMTRVREQLGPRSRGDTFVLRNADRGLIESYPLGGGGFLLGGE